MPATRIFLYYICCLCLMTVLPGGRAHCDEEGDALAFPTHGFRIVSPDPDWIIQETKDPASGSFVLVLQPKDSAGTVQLKVQVKSSGGMADAKAVRDYALDSIKTKPEYTKKKTLDSEVAGRPAPGVIVDLKSHGSVFRLRQYYLIESGMLYILQCHAPAADFKKYAPVFDRACKSFELTPIPAGQAAANELVQLAARCGTEIEWAVDWEAAAAQARKEKKLVLVVARFLGGFNITDETRTGPFMDPDVIDLVRERFVVLRLHKGMEAPFVAQDSSYGMGPSSFGTALLVATPDGEVRGDTFCLQPDVVCEFLIAQLERKPKYTGSGPPRNAGDIEAAAWHLSRGELEEAAALLGEPSSPRAHLLKASLLRRLRKGNEALTELDKARAADDGSLEFDISMDEAVVLLRIGRFDEAREVLESVIAAHPDAAGIPEAHYWLGACRLRQGDKDVAEKVWKDLTAEQPDNRWAWKAAAALTATGFELGLGERLDWPGEDLIAILRHDGFESLKVPEWRRAEKEAREFLLEQQREDGSWISPTEAHRFSDKWPNDFTEAVTAICGQSLLRFHEDERAADAISRAVEYLLAARVKRKAVGDQVYFMDYGVWSKAYVVWFFADCIDAGVADSEKLLPVMAEIVPELRAKQKEGGGWSYYVTTDLRGAGAPADQSISFVTAAVLVALIEARDAGAPVPQEMTDAAAGCLERMRDPNGTFMYMLHHGDETKGRNAAPPGAAGRGPLCALALHRYGRGSVKEIDKMLETFVENRESYANLHGKALMHTAAHTQGSHYLMFDYAFAADAVRSLPANKRGRYTRELLDQVLGARTEAGTYLDNPINGTHYATAMALMVFGYLKSKS